MYALSSGCRYGDTFGVRACFGSSTRADRVASKPRVHVKGAPLSTRQVLQWQMDTLDGLPVICADTKQVRGVRARLGA